MMKYFIIFLLLMATPAYSSTTLPWNQTYDDCPVWNEYIEDITTGPLPCAGMSKYNNSQATPGTHSTSSGTKAYHEQIIPAANYSLGLGGYGQRHWFGKEPTLGNNSGGTAIYLDTPVTEIWMRWYMRFQDGFLGTFNTMKIMYIWSTTSSQSGFQLGTPGLGGMRIWSTTPEANCSSCGWDNAFYTVDQNSDGIGDSDETWHEFEIHINLSTDVAQAWVDGVLKIDKTDAVFSIEDINNVAIGANSKAIDNGVDVPFWHDYDDFVISTTGRIGSVAGGSSGSGSTSAGSGSISTGSGSFQ